MNINVFRNLSYGVYVISSLDGERLTGCTANSVMQITSSPSTIAISINHENFTNECITKTGKFSISILSEKSNANLIGNFGFQSGRDVNKYNNVEYEIKQGLPVVSDACGYIICKVINKMETSTHTVFLGEAIDGDFINEETPMTYAYYHNVVKGKSPKAAPTYIPEKDESGEGKYVCSICGYIYEGDIPFEDLPDDYKCPICKQGKDKFIKK